MMEVENLLFLGVNEICDLGFSIEEFKNLRIEGFSDCLPVGGMDRPP